MEEPGHPHSVGDDRWLQAVAERDRLNDEIAAIGKRIDRLKTTQHRLRLERNRLTKVVADRRTWKNRSGMSDEWQVLCRDIQPCLIAWMDAYNFENRTGALNALAHLSDVSTKTISRISNGLQEFCTLTTAEMLLAAIGMPEFSSQLEWYPQKRGRPARMRPNDPPPSIYYEE